MAYHLHLALGVTGLASSVLASCPNLANLLLTLLQDESAGSAKDSGKQFAETFEEFGADAPPAEGGASRKIVPAGQKQEEKQQETPQGAVPAPVPMWMPPAAPLTFSIPEGLQLAETPQNAQPVATPEAPAMEPASHQENVLPQPAAPPELAVAVRVAPAPVPAPAGSQAMPANPAVPAAVVTPKIVALKDAPVKDSPLKDTRRVEPLEAPAPAAPPVNAVRTLWTLDAPPPAPADAAPVKETIAVKPPVEIEPVHLEAPQHKSVEPLRDLTIEIRQPNQERVALRMVERAGELHVAVRASDNDVLHGLRQELPQLVNRLEENGIRTEAWRPSGTIAAAAPVAEMRETSTEFRQDHSQQQQQGFSQEQRGQQERHPWARPQWVEELEQNLAGGTELTGEWHGFTR